MSEKKTAATGRVSHAAQKHRTRTALVTSCRTLIASGADISMPAVAQAAGVSEATAYRHFADLVSLVNEALRDLWPSPSEALAPVATSPDAVERIDFACEFLLRRVYSYQGSVRAVIGATITKPALVPTRPGFRFGLIDLALDPVIDTSTEAAALRLAQLKEDLAAVVSAEALFSLIDLCRPRRGSRHRQPPPHGPNDHRGRRRRDRRNLTALVERTNCLQPRAPEYESEPRIYQQARGRADGQRSSAPTRGRRQLHTAVAANAGVRDGAPLGRSLSGSSANSRVVPDPVQEIVRCHHRREGGRAHAPGSHGHVAG